ncbi:MAG: prolipoprotein diacylglyceryl transferase, partial [Caulobacteraceae bacterium]
MQFPEFNPVWFSIGPLDIRWYALAYVAGIVLGWWYAARIIKTDRLWAPGKAPINTQQLDDLVLWVTLGIILGGRLGFALFYQPHLYGQLFGGPDNFALFRLWDGGMSFHGGLIGCTVAVVVFALRSKVRVLTIGDIALAAAPFGLMFGRLANFINGELWGRETTVPWAVRFCNGLIERTYGFCPAGNEPSHPSQLYEAGLEGIFLMGILALAIWKVGLLRKPGYV